MIELSMGGTSNLPFTQGAMAKRSDRGKLFCLRCLLGNDFALTDVSRVAVGDRATTAAALGIMPIGGGGPPL